MAGDGERGTGRGRRAVSRARARRSGPSTLVRPMELRGVVGTIDWYYYTAATVHAIRSCATSSAADIISPGAGRRAGCVPAVAAPARVRGAAQEGRVPLANSRAEIAPSARLAARRGARVIPLALDVTPGKDLTIAKVSEAGKSCGSSSPRADGFSSASSSPPASATMRSRFSSRRCTWAREPRSTRGASCIAEVVAYLVDWNHRPTPTASRSSSAGPDRVRHRRPRQAHRRGLSTKSKRPSKTHVAALEAQKKIPTTAPASPATSESAG